LVNGPIVHGFPKKPNKKVEDGGRNREAKQKEKKRPSANLVIVKGVRDLEGGKEGVTCPFQEESKAEMGVMGASDRPSLRGGGNLDGGADSGWFIRMTRADHHRKRGGVYAPP